MKKSIKYCIVILTCWALSSCTDDILIDLPESDPKLVVEAWLKDDGAVQTIKLSRSTNYSDTDGPNKPETGAMVTIKTSGGQEFPLLENESGIYTISSEEFQLNVDSTYYLSILTSDGSEYISTNQKIDQVPVIDNFLFLSGNIVSTFGFGAFLPEDPYYCAITTTEKAGRGDSYAWKIYRNGEDLSIGNNLIYQNDDALEDGAIIPYQLALFTDSLAIGDTVKVEQMKITTQAFDYFFQLQQQFNGGGPFSTPPAPVEGNISNVNNSTELVLGFFIVSSVNSFTEILTTENTNDELTPELIAELSRGQ